MSKKKPDMYFSVDVETDGPLPGPNSMLSFGCAAFLADKTMVGTFGANLERLPEANPDPDTMQWWAQHPDAWEACRRKLERPEEAMQRFIQWIEVTAKGHSPVCVAYPAGFDFLFLYWYLVRFTGTSPFSFSCLDVKTYAMAILKIGYRSSSKRRFPTHWFDDVPHTHVALDDAIEQGRMFCNMLADNLKEGA